MEVWVEKDPTNQKYSMFQQLTGCIEETQLKLGMKQESDKMLELFHSTQCAKRGRGDRKREGASLVYIYRRTERGREPTARAVW